VPQVDARPAPEQVYNQCRSRLEQYGAERHLARWVNSKYIRIQCYTNSKEGEVQMQFDKELDAQVLKIIATDPGAVKDFQAFAKQTGNELLSSDAANKEFTFFMKKK
jgi:TusA-related sulfurtransferase